MAVRRVGTRIETAEVVVVAEAGLADRWPDDFAQEYLVNLAVDRVAAGEEDVDLLLHAFEQSVGAVPQAGQHQIGMALPVAQHIKWLVRRHPVIDCDTLLYGEQYVGVTHQKTMDTGIIGDKKASHQPFHADMALGDLNELRPSGLKVRQHVDRNRVVVIDAAAPAWVDVSDDTDIAMGCAGVTGAVTPKAVGNDMRRRGGFDGIFQIRLSFAAALSFTSSDCRPRTTNSSCCPSDPTERARPSVALRSPG